MVQERRWGSDGFLATNTNPDLGRSGLRGISTCLAGGEATKETKGGEQKQR